MNLQQILFVARSRLRDLGVKTWTEQELIASVNEGICDMSTLIRQAREDYFLATTTSTIAATTTPNPSTFTLPTDFLELKEIKVTTSGYEYIDFLAKDRSTPQFRNALIDGGSFGSGTGIVLYDIYGNNTIMFAPGFDVALDIQIDYIQLVPDLALPTDEPTLIPSKYHNMIPDYAVLEALRSANDSRFRLYDDKVKSAEKLLQVGIQPRQVREAKFVVGYMENEEW